jgi:hypothetical protein
MKDKEFFYDRILPRIEKLLESKIVKSNYESYALEALFKFIKLDYINVKANLDEKANDQIAFLFKDKKTGYLKILDLLKISLTENKSLQILASCYFFLEENEKASEIIKSIPETDEFYECQPKKKLEDYVQLFNSKSEQSLEDLKKAFSEKIKACLNIIFKTNKETDKNIDFDSVIFERAQLKIEQLKQKYPYLNQKECEKLLYTTAVHIYLKLTQDIGWDDNTFIFLFKIKDKKLFLDRQRAFCIFCDYNFELTTDFKKLTEIKA